jgi:hypothetical protein
LVEVHIEHFFARKFILLATAPQGKQAESVKNIFYNSGHRFRNTIFAQSNKLIAMSFLNAVINNVEDEGLRDELQERVDIILHKIKFMDKVPVACLDMENFHGTVLNVVIEAAGGEMQEDPMQAKVLIYHQPNTSMLELMGTVPSMLKSEWPAVEFNRVYLMDDATAFFSDPESFVNTMEDIAEMLYPGYFIFGNEGKTWMSFGI